MLNGEKKTGCPCIFSQQSAVRNRRRIAGEKIDRGERSREEAGQVYRNPV
jgi:hypothetical protein